jgi:hypothetical protein
MRNFPTKDYELKDLESLKAESWQLELLKLNPEYTSWGPYEDYMTGDGNGRGWDSPVFHKSWSEFKSNFGLDELNEVVNFYFELERTSHECPDCEGRGYNKETVELYKGWYGSLYNMPEWSDKLEKEEVQALFDAGRLFGYKTLPTPEEINREYRKGLGHDCINCSICIETRAKKLGVWGKCPTCGGEGCLYDEYSAHVNLVVWYVHPRKGASRGVEVKNITQEDIPEVLAFLKEAANRNKERFSKLI